MTARALLLAAAFVACVAHGAAAARELRSQAALSSPVLRPVVSAPGAAAQAAVRSPANGLASVAPPAKTLLAPMNPVTAGLPLAATIAKAAASPPAAQIAAGAAGATEPSSLSAQNAAEPIALSPDAAPIVPVIEKATTPAPAPAEEILPGGWACGPQVAMCNGNDTLAEVGGSSTFLVNVADHEVRDMVVVVNCTTGHAVLCALNAHACNQCNHYFSRRRKLMRTYISVRTFLCPRVVNLSLAWAAGSAFAHFHLRLCKGVLEG